MKTKIVNFVVNPENVTESLKTMAMAVTNNADVLSGVLKTNKKLAFSVFCLSCAGYLAGRMLTNHAKRIKELEETVNQLKPQTEDNPASE